MLYLGMTFREPSFAGRGIQNAKVAQDRTIALGYAAAVRRGGILCHGVALGRALALRETAAAGAGRGQVKVPVTCAYNVFDPGVSFP